MVNQAQAIEECDIGGMQTNGWTCSAQWMHMSQQVMLEPDENERERTDDFSSTPGDDRALLELVAEDVVS